MQIYNIGMRKTIYMAIFIVAFLSFFFIPSKITGWLFVHKAAAFAIAGYSAKKHQDLLPDERP